jgi:hypothetical protein
LPSATALPNKEEKELGRVGKRLRIATKVRKVGMIIKMTFGTLRWVKGIQRHSRSQ